MFNLLKLLLMVIGLGTSVIYCGRWAQRGLLWTTNQVMEMAIDAQKHQMSYAWFDHQLNRNRQKPKEAKPKEQAP